MTTGQGRSVTGHLLAGWHAGAMATAARRDRRTLPGTVRPGVAALVSLSLLACIVLLLTLVQHDLSQATRALLLVVPVIVAAVLGSRWLAYLVAAIATVAFTLSVPPIGAISFAAVDDAIALAVFLAVAVVVSTLVSSRIDSLAEADQQRRLLLRSVSHDLRTPLATIKGAATELLEGEVRDEADRTRMLRLVDREATRLDHLVANLLALSRIEAGAMEPQRSPTDVELLIRAATRRFVLGATDVRLEVEVQPDLPLVDVDDVQLSQVLDNLVDNAVRHSPPGATVTVLGSLDRSRLRIDVVDRGSGVDLDEIDQLFQPFRSGSVAGSSGVGLAICRAIVELHDGTIQVDDDHGRGTRFTVLLPV